MLRTIAVCVVTAGVIVVVPGWTDDAPAAEAEPPNVIVIMTDDMRVDDLAGMPKTRRLLGADNGLGATYTNSYATLPLCCPSRATFLTGQYAHNHGVWSNAASSGGGFSAFDDDNTLSQWLQAAGYRTSMLGKYLNEYGVLGNDPTYVPPGWDHWAGLTSGVFNYHNFDVNVNGDVRHIRGGYQTTDFTSRALRVLDNQLPTGTPQFLWLSYTAPHEDFSRHGRGRDYYVPAQPKYRGQSKVGAPKSAAFNEQNVADKPAWIKATPKLTKRQVADVVQLRRERRDALRTVDDGVAAIVAALRQNGELRNTLLLFTSDNGYLLGEHRIMRKIWPYDESVSVPLLARGPGITPGRHPQPVGNVDLAATITAVVGATPSRPQDGIPLWETHMHRPVLIELPQQWETLPAYAGVIADGWVYLEYGDQGRPRELYDLSADPWQTRNGAADPALEDHRLALADTLDRLRDCVGGGCRS